MSNDNGWAKKIWENELKKHAAEEKYWNKYGSKKGLKETEKELVAQHNVHYGPPTIYAVAEEVGLMPVNAIEFFDEKGIKHFNAQFPVSTITTTPIAPSWMVNGVNDRMNQNNRGIQNLMEQLFSYNGRTDTYEYIGEQTLSGDLVRGFMQ